MFISNLRHRVRNRAWEAFGQRHVAILLALERYEKNIARFSFRSANLSVTHFPCVLIQRVLVDNSPAHVRKNALDTLFPAPLAQFGKDALHDDLPFSLCVSERRGEKHTELECRRLPHVFQLPRCIEDVTQLIITLISIKNLKFMMKPQNISTI